MQLSPDLESFLRRGNYARECTSLSCLLSVASVVSFSIYARHFDELAHRKVWNTLEVISHSEVIVARQTKQYLSPLIAKNIVPDHQSTSFIRDLLLLLSLESNYSNFHI
jgi:hypothetical protein